MQPILIQGAMNVEIATLIENLNAVLDQTIAGFDFYKGSFNGYPIIISKTNIGMSNASCATTIGILTYKPALVINQGIAGAHSRNIHTNDIVIGQNAVNICTFEKSALATGVDYKLWKHTDFLDYDNANSDKNLSGDAKIIEILSKQSYNSGKITCGTIGSGDVWNKEIEFIDFLNQSLSTLCEDMETVGVYNVCRHFSVPVLGVRIISNNELNLEPYDTSSAKNLQEFILNALPKLTNFYQKIRN